MTCINLLRRIKNGTRSLTGYWNFTNKGGTMSAKEKNSLERYNNELDKTVEELSHVFKDRPDLVCLAIEYLYFA